MSRPDVAILLPDLGAGGVERVRLVLAGVFAADGLSVEFVLRQARGELLGELPAGVTVHDLKAQRVRDVVAPLTGYLYRRRPRSLLAAMWPLTGVAALAKALGRWDGALVVSEHNTLSLTPAYKGWSGRLHRRFGRALYRRADAVVCVSEGVRDDIAAATGLERQRLHIIHNPIRRPPTPMPPPDPAIWRWWSRGGARLICVGSLKPQKDHATLLRALARLNQSRPARLLLLGEGELRGELEALAVSLGLEGIVRMPGFVADPYPYLARADAFVLSSAWEGLGNVITEALAVGTPVVATDCRSGPAEILQYGRYGRLTPVGDAEAFAEAIVETLDTPVDRERLVGRAEDFSVDRAAAAYRELLGV